MHKLCKKLKFVGVLLICLTASSANATVIGFTDGVITRTDGGSTPCDWCLIDSYEEDGFLFEFFHGSEPAATSIGNYFGNGEDVFHGHFWPDALTRIRLTALDFSAFSLNSIQITTGIGDNVIHALADGVFSSYSQALPQDDWGSGFGADPIVTFGSEFADIKAVEFFGTNGIGFDNITINNVPVPATLLLFAVGLAGLGFSRKTKG